MAYTPLNDNWRADHESSTQESYQIMLLTFVYSLPQLDLIVCWL